MPDLILSPDCRDENCIKCPGDALDLEADEIVPCQCHHHQEVP